MAQETGSRSAGVTAALCSYFEKWSGEAKAGPGKFASPLAVLVGSLGGFAALGIMSAAVVLSEDLTRVWLVTLGSHGATMVLVFGAPAGPFSQPRNIVVGNLIASLVGVGCRIWIAQPMGNIGLALPLSVTLSYIIMHLTRSINPPAGGTAALAVVSSPEIERVGWKLVIPAVLFGVVFIVVACIFINLIPGQRYPKYWFVEASTFDCCIQSKCCKQCSKKEHEQEEMDKDSTQRATLEPDPPSVDKTTTNESNSPAIV